MSLLNPSAFPHTLPLSGYALALAEGSEYADQAVAIARDLVREHGDAATALEHFEEQYSDDSDLFVALAKHVLRDHPDDYYEAASLMRPGDDESSLPVAALVKGWEDGLYQAYMSMGDMPSLEERDRQGDDAPDGMSEISSRMSASMTLARRLPKVARAPPGVAHVLRAFSDTFLQQMNASVDRYRDSLPVADYHPGSNGHVRDILHPSMFPYIGPANTDAERATYEGQTQLAANCTFVPDIAFSEEDGKYHPASQRIPRWGDLSDEFGRVWRGSRYQWMPTEVRIDADGSAHFCAPVNGAHVDRDADVLQTFEAILTQLVPMWEHVLGCTEAAGWSDFDDPSEATDDLVVEPVSLRGRTIQVIPKIADVELRADGDSHAGVWHVEGLSHEHIAATGIAYLRRDATINGGRLRFRRSFLKEEYGYLMYNIPQEWGHNSPAMKSGLVPLGSVEPGAGDLLAFPNSHQHKLEPLTLHGTFGNAIRRNNNNDANPALAAERRVRRIVAFFLVNPEVRVVSTADIATPQTDITDYETACRVREAMMKERAAAKKDLNRELAHNFSFCEH
jgi:hypothetical protein